jgi:endonuclease III
VWNTPVASNRRTGSKEPFDIDEVFRRLRRAVAELPGAAMFALRDHGHGTPFEQLVATLISARTRDEATMPVCPRLFGPVSRAGGRLGLRVMSTKRERVHLLIHALACASCWYEAHPQSER